MRCSINILNVVALPSAINFATRQCTSKTQLENTKYILYGYDFSVWSVILPILARRCFCCNIKYYDEWTSLCLLHIKMSHFIWFYFILCFFMRWQLNNFKYWFLNIHNTNNNKGKSLLVNMVILVMNYNISRFHILYNKFYWYFIEKSCIRSAIYVLYTWPTL